MKKTQNSKYKRINNTRKLQNLVPRGQQHTTQKLVAANERRPS